MRRDLPVSRLREFPASGGLATPGVVKRRRRYGPNDIVEVATNPWISLARDTFKDPMIWFLFGIGLVYSLLGQMTEAVALFIAILPLIAMDAFLHRRTQASTEGLSRQLAASALVIRDGRAFQVPAIELVPGDVVRVSSGEAFPADGVIVSGDNLQADESSLTGEAYPVKKRSLSGFPAVRTSDSAVWIDDAHWGFAGTRLLTGRSEMRVVFTGKETLYGQIVQGAVAADHDRSPLQTAIANLVTVLMIGAASLCLLLAGVRLRQGHDPFDALISAATLAIAALPEEFPVVFSVFLGVGVYRLARRKALVRRSISVENIGRVTCICSDKTGTLTEGRLRLEHWVPAESTADAELLQWSALSARADSGDPMDTAIWARVSAQGALVAPPETIATYPYTEQRRRETTVVRLQGRLHAISKGSPELLLGCSDLDANQQERWISEVDRLATTGHKVLACLLWDLDAAWSGGEPDRGGRLLGLLAFEDPIRDSAAGAVQECRNAGIRIIMVTGDHPATATHVARALGLLDSAGDDEVILGEHLADQLASVHQGRIRVVARATPPQKLALVRALKSRQEIVAVTGDGVNDVPALQAADIGVAMGSRGTRSAREAASIILLNDDFGSLVRAIAEGRQLFRNLQLSFQYILLMHIPLVVTATFIPLMGHPLLYLPIHIVWYETLIHPTALLVFQELPAKGLLTSIAKHRASHFFSRAEWLLIAVTGMLLTAFILWAYDRSFGPGSNVEHARAMAMVALTCANASATAVLSGLRTRTAWWMVICTLGSTFLLVQTPNLAHYLNVQPLHGDDWLIALLGGFTAVAAPMGSYRLFGCIRPLFQTLHAGGTTHRAMKQAQPPLTHYAWWSIATAVATISLKASAYALTGSVALLSDAAESLVNLVAASFALLALKIAARPADDSHPFGHGKAEYFSSGFEGALILMAAAMIAYTAWERLMHPVPLQALDLGILISVVGTAINLGMARVLLRAGRRFGSITLEADGHHLMTDVWTTGAILLGLLGITVTGWLWLDSAIAIVAALNILNAGVQLIRRSLTGLLGAAIPDQERQTIESILEPYRRQGYQFHDLRSRVAGTHRLVTFHVLVPGTTTVQDAHDLLERIEAEIGIQLPNLTIVTHVEPLDDPASFRHELMD